MPGCAPRRATAGGNLSATTVEEVAATLASYAGHLRHGTAWRAWQALWRALSLAVGLAVAEVGPGSILPEDRVVAGVPERPA